MKPPHNAALAAFVLFSATAAVATAAHHWSYSGETGPTHWGALESDYAACGKGKAQSPIDISSSHTTRQALPELKFDYHTNALHLVNNGHSVQVDIQPGSTLTVGKDHYALVQFHFHHPSEEEIDGKRFDMVAHLVHRDAAGHLAVVAVPLQTGEANSLVTVLWRNLPHGEGHEVVPKGVAINVAGLLPASRGYYTYTGSLTTPPCTEGVRWIVLKTPVTISPHELAIFAHLYPNDARPVQPLNGRVVLASK